MPAEGVKVVTQCFGVNGDVLEEVGPEDPKVCCYRNRLCIAESRLSGESKLLSVTCRICRGHDGMLLDVRDLVGFGHPSISALRRHDFIKVSEDCFDRYLVFLKKRRESDLNRALSVI